MKLWKYENKLFVVISRTYAIRLFNVANVEMLPMPMLPISNHWTLVLVIGNTGNILQTYLKITIRPVGRAI